MGDFPPTVLFSTIQEYRHAAACLGDKGFGESDSSSTVSAGHTSQYEVQNVLLPRAALV